MSYRELPDYSVFEIARLSRDDCSKLLSKNIVAINDMKPRSIKLTQQQAIQVVLTQKQIRKVDEAKLKAELDTLRYPLCFLDYETYNFALPRLDGFRPYQHYVFQYSLHIQDSQESELRHHEFLAEDISLESLTALASSLRDSIPDENGSVIVWHRQFEESRNSEIGELLPEFRSFFSGLNRRIYDLEEIFKQGVFLDYQFKGRSSIKAILPVLCPQFSYGELVVQNGAQAMDAWYQWVRNDERGETTRDNLLAYCELDTLAMVEILSAVDSKAQEQESV